MVVTQAEIDLILNPRVRRRMMRLPAPNRHCPVAVGRTYRLQPRASAKGQVTITITEQPYREKLAAISLGHARKEGFAGVQGALDAWAKAHWSPTEDEMVWVISFARDPKGECATFLNEDQAVWLAKVGDYTAEAGRQAVPGDPPLLALFAEDLERARERAQDRSRPQRDTLARMRSEAETLREAMLAMKDRNGLKLLRIVERDLDRLAARFPVADGDTLVASECAERSSPVDVQDGPSHSGTDSDVPLDSAA